MEYHLITGNSNHSQCSNVSIIIITIKFPLSYSTLSLLSQVLTIQERRWFELIPTQLGNLFLTETETPLRQGSLMSPLVQFRTNLRVQSVPHPQRFYQSARKIGTRSHPWTHAIGSPHILTTSSVHTFTYQGPSWIELLDFTVVSSDPAS